LIPTQEEFQIYAATNYTGYGNVTNQISNYTTTNYTYTNTTNATTHNMTMNQTCSLVVNSIKSVTANTTIERGKDVAFLGDYSTKEVWCNFDINGTNFLGVTPKNIEPDTVYCRLPDVFGSAKGWLVAKGCESNKVNFTVTENLEIPVV
jgi:hypothetical protein